MAGYLFSNVQYVGVDAQDIDYIKYLNGILMANDSDVKTMQTGVRALAFNRAYELVYATSSSVPDDFDIHYTTVDPRNMVCVYDDAIEPEIVCGVRFLQSTNKDYKYDVDIIYADEWKYYYWTKDNQLVQRKEPQALVFPVCPVIEYNTEILSDNSPFDVALPYIDALDYTLSGNSNEIERIVDALLVLGTYVDDKDLQHMDEWKVLQGLQKEDRAEYIEKNMSPEFRRYVTDVLTQEIHKHCHVVDWYSTDGTTGVMSAKALKTKLFDMDIYSKRLEKVYRKGEKKRLSLITFLMSAKSLPIGLVNIIYNRTLPDDIEDKILALNNCVFLSDETKVELTGLPWEREKKRLQRQREENGIEIDDLTPPTNATPDANDADEEDDDEQNS